MRQMDGICMDIIDVYKNITKTTKFVNVFSPQYPDEFSDYTINTIIDRYKNNKKILKGVYPTQYNQIAFKNIVPYHISPYIENTRNGGWNKKLLSRDKTGLFKIMFNNGEILLVSRWITGIGRNEVIKSLIVGEYSQYASYLKTFILQKKINQKPKLGILRATVNQFGGTEYFPCKDMPQSPVIHPLVDEIGKDIEYYFNNVKLFTRFKQSGVRKFMLVSEPGTGKSSLFYKIAKQYEKTKSVVFCTDISSAAAHLNVCAKYKISTIIFLEDADSSLAGGQSAVLNFLDGIDTPTNPNGSLILMSTNFPEKIEPRILTRPGRIDKIYNFSALEGEWAVKCSELYFSEFFNVKRNSSKLLPIVSGLTGAQIKELALASMSYASSKQSPINVSLITEVKKMFAKNLSEAYRYADQNSMKKLGGIKPIGFNDIEEVDADSVF